MSFIHDDKLFLFGDRVKGKVVLITGGAGGIGKESALRFASNGAKVVIGDLNDTAGRQTVAEIEAAGGTATSIKCNVVVWDDLVALFEHAITKYQSIDIVIPNAGITDRGDFDSLVFKDGKPVEQKALTIDINVTAVLKTVQLAQHYMAIGQKEGDLKSIVLIGSMASWIGIPKAPLYSCSKHAILGLMRSLTKPLAFKGIRVAVIHPFFADTNILPTAVKLFLAGIPLVPVTRVAGAIFYAATDPDPETNGSCWLLPDDGPVFLLKKEELKLGVYEMIDSRVNAAFKGAKGAQFYIRLTKDVWRNCAPLRQLGLVGLVGAIAWTNRTQIIGLVSQYTS
ncbi:hypothetical protein DFP72DRAFT_874743 [Ephemerocybe angulata]|uniref:NAD(P)-binding protein n=1 Tax=Ephemerocybe angulata TaxID=980116 RepID=A0A8H6MFC9_9AGAR|nr:hypothetical protein DFP72DRAFT_874743 [Tulosesus angulatus]